VAFLSRFAEIVYKTKENNVSVLIRIFLFVYLFIRFVYLFIRFVYSFIYSFIRLFIHLFIYLFVYLYFFLFLSLFVRFQSLPHEIYRIEKNCTLKSSPVLIIYLHA